MVISLMIGWQWGRNQLINLIGRQKFDCIRDLDQLKRILWACSHVVFLCPFLSLCIAYFFLNDSQHACLLLLESAVDSKWFMWEWSQQKSVKKWNLSLIWGKYTQSAMTMETGGRKKIKQRWRRPKSNFPTFNFNL